MKPEVEMRIILKSRVPLPHLKHTRILEDGLFNVGGFHVGLNDKEAFVDWDNSLVQVNFDKDGYLVLMANMFGELDEETYLDLNEELKDVIPYEDIYKIETLMKTTFYEVSYEAYKKDYDGDIIPMDVKFINFAKTLGNENHTVFSAGKILEDANYSSDKLDVYNEREDVKWRLEGVRDPKTIHDIAGVYTSCLA